MKSGFKTGIKGAVVAGMLVAGASALPALAQDKGKAAGTGAGADYSQFANEWSKAWAKSMAAMFKTWSKMSKMSVDAGMQMMQSMTDSCAQCHAQTSDFYDTVASQFADYVKSIEGHKKGGKPADAPKKK